MEDIDQLKKKEKKILADLDYVRKEYGKLGKSIKELEDRLDDVRIDMGELDNGKIS